MQKSQGSGAEERGKSLLRPCNWEAGLQQATGKGYVLRERLLGAVVSTL